MQSFTYTNFRYIPSFHKVNPFLSNYKTNLNYWYYKANNKTNPNSIIEQIIKQILTINVLKLVGFFYA